MIAYGVKIKSDIALPYDIGYASEACHEIRLCALNASNTFDSLTVSISMPLTHGREIYAYTDRHSDHIEKGQPVCYEIRGVARFYWITGASDISYELFENGNNRLLGFWFLHLLLPYYLTVEEVYVFFHAGAVDVEGRGTLFTAPSHGGKSTMTDYFIKQGHALISDDKVATYLQEGRWMAVGSHPYRRPYRNYEDLGYKTANFQKNEQQIRTVYIFEKAGEDADVSFEEIRGTDKLSAVRPSALFSFSHLALRRFEYLAKALHGVRVFRVWIPWNMQRLDEVYHHIRLHSEGTA